MNRGGRHPANVQGPKGREDCWIQEPVPLLLGPEFLQHLPLAEWRKRVMRAAGLSEPNCGGRSQTTFLLLRRNPAPWLPE